MTTKTSEYTRFIDEYATAKVSLASDGQGFRGEVWMNSSYARASLLDWSCGHSHSTREDALACAVQHG